MEKEKEEKLIQAAKEDLKAKISLQDALLIMQKAIEEAVEEAFKVLSEEEKEEAYKKAFKEP